MKSRDVAASPSTRGGRGRARVVGLFLFSVFIMIGCGEPIGRAVSLFEDQAVYAAACRYLDAEVRRDHRAVYASLAPSSPYCAQNSYEMYLAEASQAPAIASYRIVKISDICPNEDRVRFPKIDKIARVEVEMRLVLNGVGEKIDVNFAFPFVKEGGRWYKG